LTRLTREDFGLSFVEDGMSEVRWRFLLAFQCLPAILLLAGIKFLPDSPRYLASVGKFEEAKEVREIYFYPGNYADCVAGP
jgi:Sugar (and other) transporter